MGTSTNAILFYGYYWEEEIDLLEGDEESLDWKYRFAAAKGLGAYPYDMPRSVQDAYLKRRKALIAASNCTLGYHCGNGKDRPFVAIAGSVIEARRGYPEGVKADHLAVDPVWKGQLDAFCEALGLTPPQDKPDWWLVSYWGV